MAEWTLNEYAKLAMRSKSSKIFGLRLDGMPSTERDRYPEDSVVNAALGLSGEAGEVADHLKKVIFQGHKLDEIKLIKECGDLLWYIAMMADGLGVTMEDIARINIGKLEDRYPEGFSVEKSINRKE